METETETDALVLLREEHQQETAQGLGHCVPSSVVYVRSGSVPLRDGMGPRIVCAKRLYAGAGGRGTRCVHNTHRTHKHRHERRTRGVKLLHTAGTGGVFRIIQNTKQEGRSPGSVSLRETTYRMVSVKTSLAKRSTVCPSVASTCTRKTITYNTQHTTWCMSRLSVQP